MSDRATAVRKQLELLCVRHNGTLDKGDYVTAAGIFTENATLMPHGGDELVGRKVIADVLPVIYPQYKSLVFEKFEYFDLLDENSAYTIDYTKSVDEQGQIKQLFHGSRLWKKEGGGWFVDRQLFNNRPMPETAESRIRKHIESRILTLCSGLDKRDYSCASEVYAKNAVFAPNGENMVRGREAIKDTIRKVTAQLSNIRVQETNYFRLINDNTAYTNSRMQCVDDGGTVQALFRNGFLWTKDDDEWYIKADVNNDRPLPKE